MREAIEVFAVGAIIGTVSFVTALEVKRLWEEHKFMEECKKSGAESEECMYVYSVGR